MRVASIIVVGIAAAALLATWRSSAPPSHPAASAGQRPTVAKPPSRRPPQFIVSSYDGSGGARLWKYWRDVAKRAHAHFTFFVSGVYLVDWAHHDRYAPPRNPRGTSAIGFAPDLAWVAAMRAQIALGYRDGHEIGTHYNGHFCGPDGVGT